MIETQITSDATWQLGQLADAYRAEVAGRRRAYPACAPGLCRFCGRALRLLAESVPSDAHQTCLVSMLFMTQVVAFTDEHPGVSLERIGNRLGVSSHVIRKWWRTVKEAA